MQINGIKLNGIEASEAKLNGNIVYQKIKAIDFTSCLFPTSWTAVSSPTSFKASNEYGTWNIVAYDCATSTKYSKNAFDNNATTYWQGDTLSSASASGEISINCDNIKIKPTEIYIHYKYIGGTTYKGQIQGYNSETSTWETLCTLTNASTDRQDTFSVTTENFYSKFRILCYRFSGSYPTPYIYEFKITKGSYMTI